MSSIFTKIINGELPCHKIYEDEHVFAFLDIRPISLGHALVVPKVEIDYFLDVPEPYYSAVFQASKKIGAAIQAATGCQRIGTVIAGYEVPHFHYHIIPTNSLEEFDFSKAHEESEENMKAIHEKILNHISHE